MTDDTDDRDLMKRIKDTMGDERHIDALGLLADAVKDRPYTVGHTENHADDGYDFTARDTTGKLTRTFIQNEVLADGGWHHYVLYLDGVFLDQNAASSR